MFGLTEISYTKFPVDKIAKKQSEGKKLFAEEICAELFFCGIYLFRPNPQK